MNLKPVNLFPYQIKNISRFYHRNHPVNIPPKSITYTSYWEEQRKRCIEGLWVNDKGTWVFMMPKLYFYINYTLIIDEERNRFSPDLRDIEWIVFTYILCVDGFSGFEFDDEYTCIEIVDSISKNKKMDEIELASIPPSAYNSKGKLKKYINAWDYLTKHYLLDKPASQPLGQALYENQRSNAMILSSRGIGKSMCVFVGDFLHEFLLGGIHSVNNLNKINNELLFGMGSGDSRQLQRSLNAISGFYYNQPGKYFYSDPKEKPVMGAFYKRIQGSFEIGKEVQHVLKSRANEKILLGATVQMVALTSDKTKIGAGDRFRRVYVEEVGFLSNVLDVHRANKDSLRVGRKRVGSAYYIGCVCAGSKVWTKNGHLVNVENLKIDDGILGYSDVQDTIIKQDIAYINPPQSKSCLRITTNYGRFIDCSDDHPVYIRRRYTGVSKTMKKNPEWCEASNIKIGDGIGVVDHVDIWGDDTIFDPRLIGLLIGDGSYGLGQNVRFHNADNELWNYITCKYKTIITSCSLTKDERCLRKGRILGIVKELEKLGIRGQVSTRKALPKDIFKCDKNTVCELLGGYYDADGCVSIYNDIYPVIKLSSVSIQLLEGVQILLNKLGVHGRIINEGRLYGTKGSNYDVYGLYIKDKHSIISFYENIKFYIKHKQEKLKKAYEIALNKGDKRFKKIKGLQWEKVISVEPLGLQPVYNLHAMGSNTYIVNGIQTHNTGGDLKAIQQPKMMAENPSSYDIFGIPNYWKNPNKKIALFIPWYYADKQYKDENGNTKIELSFNKCLNDRAELKVKLDSASYDAELSFNPLHPDELLRPGSKSRLPRQQAADQLSKIDTYDIFKRRAIIGKLSYDPLERSGVRFDVDLNDSLKPILEYKISDDDIGIDKEGAFIVYEYPPDFIPEGLYWVVYDPAKQSGDGPSYHSVIVYKFFHNGQEGGMYDCIVAEWIGRYEKLDDNYDLVIKIAKFFNAKIFPEINVAGFVEYCSRKRYWSMLEGDAYMLEQEINPNGKRSYYKVGFIMNERKKNWCIDKLASWLLEVKEVDSITSLPRSLTIDWILSKRILNEIINYDPEYGNYDHISSLLGLMLLIGKLGDTPVDTDQNEDVYNADDVELVYSGDTMQRCKFLTI